MNSHELANREELLARYGEGGIVSGVVVPATLDLPRRVDGTPRGPTGYQVFGWRVTTRGLALTAHPISQFFTLKGAVAWWRIEHPGRMLEQATGISPSGHPQDIAPSPLLTGTEEAL